MCTFPRDLRGLWNMENMTDILIYHRIQKHIKAHNVHTCIWLRHFCNKGNILLNQHFQKTNHHHTRLFHVFVQIPFPGCRTHMASAHSSGSKDQRKILFPSKLFLQFFPRAVRAALPHPLRNRLLSPAQPESLPYCHSPSPTPNSW